MSNTYIISLFVLFGAALLYKVRENIRILSWASSQLGQAGLVWGGLSLFIEKFGRTLSVDEFKIHILEQNTTSNLVFFVCGLMILLLVWWDRKTYCSR